MLLEFRPRKMYEKMRTLIVTFLSGLFPSNQFFVVFTPKKDGVRNRERSIGKIRQHWYEIVKHDNSVI